MRNILFLFLFLLCNCFTPKNLNSFTIATIICDGKGGFKIYLTYKSTQLPSVIRYCLVEHEKKHVEWFQRNHPNVCVGMRKGTVAHIPGASQKIRRDRVRETECEAYQKECDCLKSKRSVDNFQEVSSEISWIQDFTFLNYGCKIE